MKLKVLYVLYIYCILLYVIVDYCSRFLILLPKIFITSHCAFVVGHKIFIWSHFVHLTTLLWGYNGEDTILCIYTTITMTYNNNKIEITITITYNRNVMYHVKERTAAAATAPGWAWRPRLVACQHELRLGLTPWMRHECHAEVCMQCWSVAHAAPPRRATVTGPGCSPRFAGPGALRGSRLQVIALEPSVSLNSIPGRLEPGILGAGRESVFYKCIISGRAHALQALRRGPIIQSGKFMLKIMISSVNLY